MIGSGFLSMAYVAANGGWCSFVLILTAASAASYCACVMVLEAGEAVALPTGGLSEVVERVLGVGWRRVLDGANALTCLGCSLTYFNVIGSLGAGLLKGARHSGGDAALLIASYPGFMVVAVALFAAPFCFRREYGELGPVNFAALALSISVALYLVGDGAAEGNLIPAGPKTAITFFSNSGNVVYATMMQHARPSQTLPSKNCRLHGISTSRPRHRRGHASAGKPPLETLAGTRCSRCARASKSTRTTRRRRRAT